MPAAIPSITATIGAAAGCPRPHRRAGPARAQAEIAEALHAAYPQELDETGAAALVGALVGALISAASAGVRRGDDPERLTAELRRATEIAVRGIAAPVPAPPN